jgi:hypothetical protein
LGPANGWNTPAASLPMEDRSALGPISMSEPSGEFGN